MLLFSFLPFSPGVSLCPSVHHPPGRRPFQCLCWGTNLRTSTSASPIHSCRRANPWLRRTFESDHLSTSTETSVQPPPPPPSLLQLQEACPSPPCPHLRNLTQRNRPPPQWSTYGYLRQSYNPSSHSHMKRSSSAPWLTINFSAY